MPFVIPIQNFEDAETAQLVFAGSTDLALTATVQQSFRATLAGATALTLNGSVVIAGEIEFAGSTALALTGRLNDEVNVFGSLVLAGATGLQLAGGLALWSGGLRLAGATALTLNGTVVEAEEFGFTFFVDILPAGVVAAGRFRAYRSRLLADGVEVPVRSVAESAPRGALGVSLSITLLAPDPLLVADAAEIKFEVDVWDGAGWATLTILEGGKIAGREVRYANAAKRPADVVTCTTLDVLGDRWTLRPEAATILYDPDQTEAPGAPDTRSAVRDERGGTHLPVSTAIPGLRLHEVFRRAYVEGCGFAAVETNLENSAVARADFTLEGGYHAGVVPLVALFDPLYFAGDGDTLWVFDPDSPLPAGLSPIVLSDVEVESVEVADGARTPVEAIIVISKEDARAGGDYFTERLEQETQEAGSFGSLGYTSTTTTRRVREYRNLSAPEIIVREEVVSIESETTNHLFEVVARETQADSIDALGRKSGHTRTVEALVPDLAAGGALALQTVTVETYLVTYRASSRPGVDEIAQTTSEVAGLVLIDDDKPYLERPYEMPYLDAHHSGYIDPEANQTAEFRAIRTVVETYVREGAAVEVRRQVSNFLNGVTSENSTAQTRAGSIAVPRGAQGTVRRMLTAEGSTGALRVVPTSTRRHPRRPRTGAGAAQSSPG